MLINEMLNINKCPTGHIEKRNNITEGHEDLRKSERDRIVIIVCKYVNIF